ncbi:hypothetical protein [Psychroflexus salis]|uniref:Uncharacterized protein n=1 Tax=Psychroflexus salis TaxID=1526574 RepID=A0A917EC73_9FLAO|nr:hypothetical protein [Psychroflexus salis]GGE22989.1 hypothetical protein GCM10010831_24880 [Psychroflexus salis]
MTPTEFENHQLFEKLEQLDLKIRDEELRELVGVDDLNFFETALKYLYDRLNLTIPSIVQESELNTISTELQNALSQINSFVGNKNQGHVTNAKNHTHTALARVRNLPLPFSKNDFNFSKNIANFEKIVKEKYSEIEKENSELKTEFEQLKSELEQTQTEVERLEKALEQKENELNNINETFKTNFDNIKSTATQNYEQDRSTFRNEFDETVELLNKEVETLKNSIDSGTDDLVAKLEAKLEEAKKIVGVVSDKAVTGNYQNVANDNMKTADRFRWIAIGLMLVLSGLLIYTIWDISGDSFDWTKSLIRILSAAALSYPATYAARESSKHRRLESLNRKAELELTAIGPFIELLPDEKKQEIKEKLVEKYFGNNHNSISDLDDKRDENVSIGTIERIVKTLIPFLKK